VTPIHLEITCAPGKDTWKVYIGQNLRGYDIMDKESENKEKTNRKEKRIKQWQ